MKIYVKFLLIITLFYQCSDKKNPVYPYEESGIAFYFLKNTNLSIQVALQNDINTLKTQSKPWLTSDDISIYDYSTHLIYLKGDKENFIPNLENQNNSGLIPFILKVKNKAVFVGALYTKSISYLPPCPTIQGFTAFEELYPHDVIQLINMFYGISDSTDVLSDENFKQALIQSSIYHGGISVELDSIAIVENSDTSTINYTFTYKNNDVDDLYLLDPSLIPADVFHCFSSGILFRDKNGNSIMPIYQEPCPLDHPYNFNPSWFTKILSKEKLVRTVNLKGYPNIPPGPYNCNFYLMCMFQIELSQRYLAGTRYWIGRLISNQKELNFYINRKAIK